jgi:hypothetical protein
VAKGGTVTAKDGDSNVTLRAMLLLPAAELKAFEVASIMGSWRAPGGHKGKLKEGERCIATEVSPKQRAQVCDVLGIAPKSFTNMVTHWVKLKLAHLCGKGYVTLFVSPLDGIADTCVNCRGLVQSRNLGTESPDIRDEVSRNLGTAAAATSGATSENDVPTRKGVSNGEREGGTSVPGRLGLKEAAEVLSREEEAQRLSALKDRLGAQEVAS